MITAAAARDDKKSKVTSGARAYERLKELIISGQFAPGSVLDENELAQRLSVSRTPVREAFIRLSTEGLISTPPNRSPTVSDLSFSDVTEHLEIMDILTPSVCYLAALRRTPAELEAIKEQVDRFSATRRDELHQRLDAIYQIYTILGNACHNASLSHLFRLAIYARRRIGRYGAVRSESQRHWEAQMKELREVLGNLYNSIASGNASAAQLAAKDWMGIVRGRLSSAVSASQLTDSAVQLHG